ncbi:VOC family protein [Umezawaea sp. Da 62-37]|uniref:VOC family protein n=1 Tax=Umezawaea sp. Da 62-37 TaxID=3075927 RepID=UPI0028F6F45A|nr:VOC family protein [Umezawaea sp. Da 62-37]WNV90460.1 VOC family protein [Umezawaea sp. Da 62-37]
MPAPTRLATIVLDCSDPAPLAEFYRAITEWEVTSSDADSAYLGSDGVQLAFVRVADYQPPNWPGTDKQAHLDFHVTDLDQTVAKLLALGATKPEFQPGNDQWVVLADPQGHLLCLLPQD